MAKINRSDVIQKAVNELAFSTSSDKIPTETLDKVQLTYDLNKKFSNFLKSETSPITGTITITLPSVSAGAETYLTGISIGITKDATCDNALGAINLSIIPADTNVAVTFLRIPVLTLTAQSENKTLSLAYPLKVKNGSTITSSMSYTAGLASREISVVGFTTSSN